MTKLFENGTDSLQVTNGMFDLLALSGVGLIAGCGPSYREGRTVWIGDTEFRVKGEDDCRLFARLVRVYARVLLVRAQVFETVNERPVGDADRSFGVYALLRQDELHLLEDIAQFFERSQEVWCD